ncbi:sugar phosphate isomerase/epimerase family protein [Paenibacillus sp. LHD-38]|uniref:sugar phosphate isomerase/epimerase family protein n=1 Tax=Paenibacillus sp. LHD-38 TaxID=3072143 RepID=UPI00280CA735|nr:sugar phosphate isomerase/epimerase family protein [Paenibacillus sp. LHD-38]MDQ8736207.1 sugar phosphate isomerase/epimerase family protein [Paenibacillus sp. LHD-38]
MLRGLTRAGLGRVGDDKRLIELAAENGFQAVEIDAAGLIETYGLEAARELLNSYGMAMGAFDLGVDWRNGEEEFLDGLALLEARAKAAALLGSDTCCTYILPSTALSPAVLAVQAVRRLRRCADIVGVYGVKLGLEFVGPHHWQTTYKHPFIHTMEDTLAFMDAIDRPNVGLLLDSYHWHTNGLTTGDLERLSSNQVAYVHINDAKSMPIEQVLDHDRLYPGEGVIDLSGFLRSLRKIGYTGVVAQEVLMPYGDDVQPTTEEAFLRSKAGFDRVFSTLGDV